MSDADNVDTGQSAAAAHAGAGRPFLLRAVLFPQMYAWFVFLGSIDLLFTWAILQRGGRELNFVACWIIEQHQLVGLVVYKFALVLMVVFVCEAVGRRSYALGQRLARWAVAVTTVPVIIGAVHLLRVLMEALDAAAGAEPL